MTNHPKQFIEGNLLIIGNIPDKLSFFCPLLREKGYNIHHTTSPQQGLEMASTHFPHLIILSTSLQEPDSYTLCQKIKDVKMISQIPILFLVLDHLTFDVWKIYKIGGSDYLSEPYHPQEILTRIQHQMTIAKLQKRLDHQSSQLERTLLNLYKLETSMEGIYDNLKISFYDALTKVANRRRFEEVLDKEWRRCARERISLSNDQTFLSLILGNLDYFTAYNDQLGLEAGDRCLQDIAQAMQAVIKRPADLIARYSGATFAILLPYTNAEGALQVTNLIRFEIEQLKIPHPNSQVSQYLTLSFGVATGIPSNILASNILTRTACYTLEQAKQKGGNCIICDSI